MHELVDYRVSYNKLLTTCVEDGIPWSDAIAMQNSLSPADKGWNIKVQWKTAHVKGDPIGLGVFAGEDLPKGTVLRTGIIGKNLITFNAKTNLPNLQDNTTAEYLKGYAFNCDCNVANHVENIYIFVPGNSMNHATQNKDWCVHYVCSDMGVNMVAVRDIRKGEEFLLNYRTHGPAPKWFVSLLNERTGGAECCFKGQNEFV